MITSQAPILETERLSLFELTIEDAPFIFNLLNDPDFHRYIGDRGVRTQEDARIYLSERLIQSYEDHGFGFYTVRLKGEAKSLGIAGLIKRPFLEHVDIGYAFLPGGRGKGFAFESTLAVYEYGKNTLNLGRIGAICTAENERSIKLLEKLGLSFEKMMKFPDDDEEVMFFLSE